MQQTAGARCGAFGSKVNLLSMAMARGLPVLPGFCVTFELMENYVQQLRRFSPMIRRAYEDLCGRSVSVPVIVRSSCELEDTEYLLFPGVFQSLHHVGGFDALLDAIGQCCRSVYTRRVEQLRFPDILKV